MFFLFKSKYEYIIVSTPLFLEPMCIKFKMILLFITQKSLDNVNINRTTYNQINSTFYYYFIMIHIFL